MAAELVVDVGDDEVPVPVVGLVDGVEEVEEGDGVGAARAGDKEAAMAGQKRGAMQMGI